MIGVFRLIAFRPHSCSREARRRSVGACRRSRSVDERRPGRAFHGGSVTNVLGDRGIAVSMDRKGPCLANIFVERL